MSEGHFPEYRVFEPIGQDSFWLGCQDVCLSEKRQELPMTRVLSLWPHWSMSGPTHKHPPYLTWRHQVVFVRPYTDGIRYCCQRVPVSFCWRWRIESYNTWASSGGLGGTGRGVLFVTCTQTICRDCMTQAAFPQENPDWSWPEGMHMFFFLWLLLVELHPGAPQLWGLKVTCSYLYFF